jgi:uncharacterized protein
MIEHVWHNHKFILTPQRVAFWPARQTLLVSDMHIGKTGHFRKEGIAVPQQIYNEDLMRFFNCLQQFKPSHVIITGDLFHSKANLETNWFAKWRADFANTKITLVLGNHDKMHNQWYIHNNIEHTEELKIEGIKFIHNNEANNEAIPTISGHVHPAVVFKTGPKQTTTLPCFYFSGNNFLLPAFSRFSGSFKVSVKKTDHIFGVINNELIKV